MNKKQRNLTGVCFLSSRVGGAGTQGGYRDGGLGAGVRPLAELIGSAASRVRGRMVGWFRDDEGRLRELRRALLIELHRLNHCTETTHANK